MAQAHAAVDLDPIGQLAVFDEMVDIPLGQVGGVGADIPVVLTGHRAHTRPGGVDRHLDHVLGAMHEVGKGVNVVVDRADQQLILDTRVDPGDLRVVLEHLVEVVLRV